MHRPHLEFENCNDLTHNVYEIGWFRTLYGKWTKIRHHTGWLRFGTGVGEGWWFLSSDDSINWHLGPRVRDAMKELRRRYLGEQKKSNGRRPRQKRGTPPRDRSRTRRRRR